MSTIQPHEPVPRKSRYNIEFAHIYTDEIVNGNHFESTNIVLEVATISELQFTTAVLIDDYNASSLEFSTIDFLKKLESHGVRPDFYVYESDLVSLANEFLNYIEKPKVFRMHKSYIERKGKYPCSLLTAVWYLIRLGYMDGSKVVRVNNSLLSVNDIYSERLINILPSAFKHIETDTHKLIGHSKFHGARYKIQPILFDEKAPVRQGFVPDRVSVYSD